MTYEVMGLFALAAIIWFWLDSRTAHESATHKVRCACREAWFQLLDDTTVIFSLKLARNDRGALVFRRIYEFEYSDDGDNRIRGTVHLDGANVTLLDIGALQLK